MLLALRDKATGWLGIVVIGILIIPFALWGITDLVSNATTPYVAKVNGEKITEEEFKDLVDRMLMRQKTRPSGDALRKFKDRMLQSVIDREVVVQSMLDIGYAVSDRQIEGMIHADPGFQEGGKFDLRRYQALLNQARFTDQSYRKDLKRRVIVGHFRFGVIQSEFVSDQELADILQANQRTIALSYVTVPVSKFKPAIALSDNDLKAYYDRHKKDYMTEEKVKLAYLELRFKDIYDAVQVKEKELQDFYKANKKNFRTAPIYKASHIFFKLDKKASAKQVAAVKKKAEAVLARLKKGEKFSKLVNKVSEDKLSPGGDLGVIDPDANKEFYAAVSKLKVGEYSPPVRSKHGFHVLKLTLKKPGKIKTYAQAKAEIEKKFRHQRALKLYRKKGEQLSYLTFENSETLEVAADKLKLKIQVSDWLTRKKTKTGLGAYPKLLAAAFSEEVLAEGSAEDSVNSARIELDPRKDEARFIVLRLKAFDKSKVMPLAQVKDKVREALLQKKSAEKAKQQGVRLYQALQKNAKLADLAKSEKLKLVEAKKLTRYGKKPHSRELVQQAFKDGVPRKDKPLYGRLQLKNGDYIVYQVVSSTPGKFEKKNKLINDYFRKVHADLFGRNAYIMTIQALRKNMEVEVNRKLATKEKDED